MYNNTQRTSTDDGQMVITGDYRRREDVERQPDLPNTFVRDIALT